MSIESKSELDFESLERRERPWKRKKPTKLEWKAYLVFWAQKYRKGICYSAKDFISWYVKEYKKKKWVCAHVARHDHNKLYSFDNIFMQERSDNIKERNARRGNPCATHRKVISYCLKTNKKKLFNSKMDAARFYNISEKTVYNHCQKRTKQFFKFGKNVKITPKRVRFEWNS